MSSLKHWIWLATRNGLHPHKAVTLLQWYGSPEQIFYAEEDSYRFVPELMANDCRTLLNKDLRNIDGILRECDRLGIRIITYQDAAYPERLRNIYSPPLLLYVKGRNIPFDERVVIGMVGTRKCTRYGERMASKIAYGLAKSGAVTVSGIAEGIDAAALDGAIQGGGEIVSVLGGGIDVHYPYCNRALYDVVAERGMLISEYPPGTRPLGQNFPIRNRIISGLSLGVVVVESDLRGGSMRTVEHVEDQNRDLYAVPGLADVSSSAGTNALIREGSAQLVRNSQDILENYVDRYAGVLHLDNLRNQTPQREKRSAPAQKMQPAEVPRNEDLPVQKNTANDKEPESSGPVFHEVLWEKLKEDLNEDQQAVLLAMGTESWEADQLIEQIGKPSAQIMTALTLLQVQGLIAQEEGNLFRTQVKLKME